MNKYFIAFSNICDNINCIFLYSSHAYHELQLNADRINEDFFITLQILFSLITVRQISSFSVFRFIIQVNGNYLKFVFTVRFKALFIFWEALICQKTPLLQLVLNQGRSDLYELKVRSNKNKQFNVKIIAVNSENGKTQQ